MQLDRIRIQPRLRNAWQSIDLGWVMARRWFVPLFLSWAIPYLLTLAIAFAALPRNYWGLGVVLVWLLKPLWDAGTLFMLSRRLFGERVSLPTAWLSALRLMRWETLPWLTWRRLSPLRSMDMPVTVLEQLRGKARSRRLGVLHLKSANGAGWLTIVCAHLEMAIGLGLLSLLFWFVPDEQAPSITDFFSDGHWALEALNYAAFGLAAALVAPFYVAAGFSLYINRRIDLEGWDIEIRFRHMATTQSAHHALRRGGALIALLAALWLCPSLAPRSYADTPPNPSHQQIAPEQIDDEPTAEDADAQPVDAEAFAQEQKDARARIDKILAGKDFNRAQPEKRWRLKQQNKDEAKKSGASKVPDWLIALIEALEKIFGFSSDHRDGLLTLINLLRLLFWATLIGLFAWLLYRYRDSLREWLHLPVPARRQREAAPAVMFGLDVRAESLPDDVIAEVNRLWQAQRTREALSLLYRAALAQLLQKFALPFRDDMTEGECVHIAAQQTPADIATYFTRLTRVWQRQAYAHTAPDADAMQAFCNQWPQLFRDGMDRHAR